MVQLFGLRSKASEWLLGEADLFADPMVVPEINDPWIYRLNDPILWLNG